MRFHGTVRVLALLVADAVTIAVVWIAVVTGYHSIWHAHYRFGAEFYWRMWPVIPAFVGLNTLFRLYHGNAFYPSAPHSPVEEMRRLIGSALITHLGAIAAIVLMRQTMVDFSRLVVVLSGLLTAVLAQPVRDLARVLMFKLGIGQIPVVVLGSGAAAERAVTSIRGNPYIGFRIVGFFDREGRELPGLVRLGGLRDVVSVSRRLGVKILVACEEERLFRCLLRDFTDWFTFIEYLPTAATFPIFGSRTISLSGMGGVEMINQSRIGFLRVEKWLLDKLLSLVAFALLSPFFVIVPVLIKLTSRGPVFYRQRRLGKNGTEIRVWKFRSMYVDADERLKAILAEDPVRRAEWKSNFKLSDDPRVTPLGRILRKTSIDEFPQLFNVFSGEMALVGPRPIVEKEVPYYGDSYSVFSSVKPGITGLWQACGRSDTGYARRVSLDVEYVLNWSPWTDIWILFRTVYAVIFMRGAC